LFVDSAFLLLVHTQPTFLVDGSCLTFCSHKVDATVRWFLFICFNLIIGSVLKGDKHCWYKMANPFIAQVLSVTSIASLNLVILLQGSYQLQVAISAQEAGARDMSESPYSSYSYSGVPPSSLPHIIR
jgi:hypothetical protein